MRRYDNSIYLNKGELKIPDGFEKNLSPEFVATMVERFKSEMQTTNTNDRVIVIAGRRVVWLTNLHRCQDITPYREAQKEPWTLVTGRPVALQPEILTVEQMEAAGHFGLYEWEESFNRRMAQLSKGIFE